MTTVQTTSESSELLATLINAMKKTSTPGTDDKADLNSDYGSTPCPTATKTWWPSQWQMEEMVMYFLLLLLFAFLSVQITRCVRTTLDPYNTLARAAWYETFNKARVQTFV